VSRVFGPFIFDWAAPPLSSNQRLHWARKAELTRTVRSATGYKCRALPVLERVRVDLVWVVNDKRRRDADNVTPTLKAMCDGLIDVGLVDDDTPIFMEKSMPRIEYRKGEAPHLELTITEVTS
jgi:crossover junction endodeoxyribonuclease RusA